MKNNLLENTDSQMQVDGFTEIEIDVKPSTFVTLSFKKPENITGKRFLEILQELCDEFEKESNIERI